MLDGRNPLCVPNNKRNESITLQSKSSLQIFTKLMEKGTIKLSQPTDSSNSEVFVNVQLSLVKCIGEFLMAYKKMSALI